MADVDVALVGTSLLLIVIYPLTMLMVGKLAIIWFKAYDIQAAAKRPDSLDRFIDEFNLSYPKDPIANDSPRYPLTPIVRKIAIALNGVSAIVIVSGILRISMYT